MKESLALIAHCLGWTVKNIVETGDAVVADHNIRTQYLAVKKGQTCGLHQHAEATVNGRVCLTLDLKMYLDAKNPHDAVQVEGDPPLDVVINGGVAGDQATVAALVNTAPRLLNAPRRVAAGDRSARPADRLISSIPKCRRAAGTDNGASAGTSLL